MQELDLPAMELSSAEVYNTASLWLSNSLYGPPLVKYAERWARMMQRDLANGKTLVEVWLPTSHEADYEGESGNSVSMAAHFLSLCWIHGTELRRLYNEFWGVTNDDGTANPAFILLSENVDSGESEE